MTSNQSHHAVDLPPNLWPSFFRLVFGSESPSIDSPSALDRLVRAANNEGLFGLLYEDPRVPQEVAREVRAAPALHTLYRRRCELQLIAARRLVNIVGSDRFLFFKGFDYRYRLHSRPELRPSADIDVYLPAQHLSLAVEQLVGAGYPQVFPPHLASYSPDYYEVSINIDEVRIELHRSFGQRARTSVNYEAVWRDREPFHVGGFTASRFSPLHAVGVHALNLAKDEMSGPLIQYVDLWLMLRRWPDLLSELRETAKEWGIERALYASLKVTTSIFPDSMTEGVAQLMESILTPSARRFLDKHVIPDRRRERSGHRSRGLQLWRKYWLTDGLRRRAALAWHHVGELAGATVRVAVANRSGEKRLPAP